jgi:hypothetical protein
VFWHHFQAQTRTLHHLYVAISAVVSHLLAVMVLVVSHYAAHGEFYRVTVFLRCFLWAIATAFVGVNLPSAAWPTLNV